ncbi:MAG: hypothetical protein SFU98_02055 [Leptospiraceae bacterium]|nr:hypothetical protein [Leptospiraceae bacterium]
MNFKKPTNPGDILAFLDNLVDKIPDRISKPLTKLVIVLFVIGLLYTAYIWAKKGYAMAPQQGQELGKDTKTLFLEEIERTYNRKRTNVRMPDSSTLLGDDALKAEKRFEYYGRERQEGENSLVTPDPKLLEHDSALRNSKSKTGYPGLSENSGTGYVERTGVKADSFSSEPVTEDEFYSKSLKVSEDRARVINRKAPGELPAVNEDTGTLKNEIPKEGKKEKLYRPKSKSNGLSPIEN